MHNVLRRKSNRKLWFVGFLRKESELKEPDIHTAAVPCLQPTLALEPNRTGLTLLQALAQTQRQHLALHGQRLVPATVTARQAARHQSWFLAGL